MRHEGPERSKSTFRGHLTSRGTTAQTQPPPPWRQPRGRWMVSLVNSHTNATRIGWHLWEIDLRFAPGLPPGWWGCVHSGHVGINKGLSHQYMRTGHSRTSTRVQKSYLLSRQGGIFDRVNRGGGEVNVLASANQLSGIPPNYESHDPILWRNLSNMSGYSRT